MTEDYRNELFSRISKLNYTKHLYIKRTAVLAALGLFALFCGYFAHFILSDGSEASGQIFETHFCCFFKGSGAIDCIRSVILYSAPDLAAVLLAAFLGYTMLSGTLGKLLLFLHCARLGLCLSFLWDYLIKEPRISDGTGAFILFALSKLAVITALIFSLLRSEDFSYCFGEIFASKRHPHFDSKTAEYIKTMVSTAGFTVITNTIYLIFQSLQNYTPL